MDHSQKLVPTQLNGENTNMALLNSTPKADGFRMPGEFEPQSRVWMIWPQRPDVWRDGAAPGQQAFVNVATAISQFTPVTLLTAADQLENARSQLPESVSILEMPSNDSWMRDSGPSFVVNDEGELRLVDWQFNAYGGLEEGLYYPWEDDDRIPERLSEHLGLDRYRAPIICEGGAIHVDGEGTLMTTPDCLLNPNRRGEKSKGDIEQALSDYLNLEKIIWLDCDMEEETDGHVDQLVAFVRPGEVMLTWTDDQQNDYYDIVHEAYEVLAKTTDAQGRRLKIHKLYQPEPMFLTAEEAAGIQSVDGSFPREAGFPVADCYINYLITNNGIIVPTFDQPKADNLALSLLSEVFPKHAVVGVPSREIGIGGGLIHCITQQQPGKKL